MVESQGKNIENPMTGESSIPVFSIDPSTAAGYFETKQTSLLDYWDLVVSRRVFIALTTAVFGLVGLISTAVMSREYEARIHLLPPAEHEIPEIILPSIGGQLETHSADSQEIYRSFLSLLESRAQQRRYFDENQLLRQLVPESHESADVLSVFASKFHKQLSVVRKGRSSRTEGPLSVTLAAPDPDLAASWLNEFVDFADRNTASAFVENLRRKIQTRLQALHDEIDARRSVARKRRDDRVAVLKEAADIARRLKIENIMDAALTMQSNKTAVSVHTESPPTYMRGTQALRREIEALQKRASDEPFIDDLRPLQERISRLLATDLDAVSLSTVLIDQAAIPEPVPVRPDFLKIIPLALLGGLLLGILVVVVQDSIRKQRRRDVESSSASQTAADPGSGRPPAQRY